MRELARFASCQRLFVTALVFFVGYAMWELAHFSQTSSYWALLRSGASLLASAALALYLRSSVRSPRGR
ncbi:MAG: hypothetical protein ACE5JJ_01255 [Nitrospinota bacterium]